MTAWINVLALIVVLIIFFDWLTKKKEKSRLDTDFETEEKLLIKHGFDPEESAYWHANRVAQLKLLDEINDRLKRIEQKIGGEECTR